MTEGQAVATTAPRARLPRLPGARGLALLVGIAASVAVGVGVVLWMQKPDFQLLYGNLTDRDAASVIQGLEGAGIPYRVSGNAVLVPADRVHDARLKLASQGLPQGTAVGLEMIQEDKGFGTSQLMENARYQHALETELARTISTLQPVQSARVHLALPRATALLRNRTPASASVLVNLYPGRRLEAPQVAAITHLVASSIPELDPSHVTLLDQTGQLLTSPHSGDGIDRAGEQFDVVGRMEDSYSRRIVALLEPLVGPGKVRAEVTAAVDFTESEQVSETYGTEKAAVRSEQTSEETKRGGLEAQGVPGALSNQPPEDAPRTTAGAPPKAGATPAKAPTPPTAQSAASTQSLAESEPTSTSRHETRNYELDRTLSRKRPALATLRRLSVAVLVDSTPSPAAAAEGADKAAEKATAAAPVDTERMTKLVKEAVGFDETRGDTVSVVTAAFQSAPVAEGTEGVPVWRNPALFQGLKQVFGVLLVALIVFTVLRPVARRVVEPDAFSSAPALPGLAGRDALPGSTVGVSGLMNGMPPEQQLAAARNLVGQDPRRVAQTMRRWLESDG